jgi:hypothetical protein
MRRGAASQPAKQAASQQTPCLPLCTQTFCWHGCDQGRCVCVCVWGGGGMRRYPVLSMWRSSGLDAQWGTATAVVPLLHDSIVAWRMQ